MSEVPSAVNVGRTLFMGGLRSRLCDVLMCASVPLPDSLWRLWNRGGLHARCEALVRLLESWLPELVASVRRRCLSEAHVDGVAFPVEPIDRGRAVTVYRLAGDDRVLKVYRVSLGLNEQRLQAWFKRIQRGEDELQRWYKECKELLVPTRLIMTPSPTLHVASIALLQPLVMGEIKDFFRDQNDEQLLQLLAGDEVLREQFVGFVAGTRTALGEGSRCFDMYGVNNLMLVLTPDGWRLKIVDYGVYDLDERKRVAPQAFAGITQMHERLFRLHDQIGRVP